MATTIQIKLDILPGNKIIIPGKEPISAFTSNTLAANINKDGIPTTSIISLEDAMRLIPNAQIVATYNPYRKYFVLPAGPPPIGCPCTKVEDYYQLLRDNAEQVKAPSVNSTYNGDCDVFPLPSRCNVL